MRTANVTYNAPARDSKVVEMGGVTFFDGQTVEINDLDHAHMFGKIQRNQHFDVEIGDEEQAPPRRKPGRPSNAEREEQAKQAEQSKAGPPKGEPGVIGFTGTSPAPEPQKSAEKLPQLEPIKGEG